MSKFVFVFGLTGAIAGGSAGFASTSQWLNRRNKLDNTGDLISACIGGLFGLGGIALVTAAGAFGGGCLGALIGACIDAS